MLSCGDCTDVECPKYGQDEPACDNYDGGDVVTTIDVYGDEVFTIKEAKEEIEALKATIVGLNAKVIMQGDLLEVLESKFGYILSAVIRAAGEAEEER